MYAKKRLNQNNYIMKNTNLTRNEEWVARKRSYLNESEEEKLGQSFTKRAGEQKQNSAPELENGMENPQQWNDINKLKKKLKVHC
jgi:hypothetical protein